MLEATTNWSDEDNEVFSKGKEIVAEYIFLTLNPQILTSGSLQQQHYGFSGGIANLYPMGREEKA
jgi:hypothetical protein